MAPDSRLPHSGQAAWTAIVHASPVVKYVGDGALLITPGTGVLLALNGSGACVYAGLSRGQSLGEISAGLASRFGISRERAANDVESFLASEPVAAGSRLAIDESPFRFAGRGHDFVVTRDDRSCLEIALDGQTMTIVPTISAALAKEAVRWATAKLAILQGRPVLHASAVRASAQGALAFSGRSGAGKTTLAHAFAKSGAELVCQDSVVLQFDRQGADRLAMLLPFEDQAREWTDAILARAEPGKPFPAKLPLPDEKSAIRLDRILFVDRARRAGHTLSTAPLGPTAAVAAVLVNFFWASLARAACERALDWALETVSLVSVEELTVPDGVPRLTSTARAFLDGYATRKTASY